MWQTLQMDVFEESQIREYVGEFADRLLPVRDERWSDPASYARKQGWKDLLRVPILLSLMKRLAVPEMATTGGWCESG